MFERPWHRHYENVVSAEIRYPRIPVHEILNVPEHLRDLAEWVCQQCTNTAPKRIALEALEEPIRRQFVQRRRKKAA